MKITVKKTKTNKNPWEDAYYPLVCKNKEGVVGIALGPTHGALLDPDTGEMTIELQQWLSWANAGFVPCTEPVTITFEN